MEYRAPLRDMQFLIREVFDFETHYGGLEDSTPTDLDLVEAIIAETARFAEVELAPLYQSGDAEGCRFVDGQVIAPTGFKEAFQQYVEGGWGATTGDPDYGGQGLPHSVGLFIEEILTSGNLSWTMYASLSRAAVNTLQAHGDAELKSRFLPKLLTGEWTGTMCLTEPHCGSDVGLLTTKAEPTAGGDYSILGTKIFISSGQHDLSDNIIHLVLARLPDAPSGTKGISLFIVPREIDGERNGVVCGAIESKMGLHGNATCMLHFENAKGFLLGPENQGMRCMFTMMNTARIMVGVQAVGLMELGFQSSLGYAEERRQMRAMNPREPGRAADPIIEHADVRRMLLTQKAFLEGGRALSYYVVQLADNVAFGSSDGQEAANRLLDFLTPIVKGFVTEVGYEAVNEAVQVYGGHGYVSDNGVEQLVRDARIARIYEGTTQIQALDLLGRKTLGDGGRALADFMAVLLEEAAVSTHGDTLRHLAQEWEDLTRILGADAMRDQAIVGSAAFDYLMYSGYVVMAVVWSRMARFAGNDDFGVGKRQTCQFFYDRLLPRAEGHRRAIENRGDSIDSFELAGFSHH